MFLTKKWKHIQSYLFYLCIFLKEVKLKILNFSEKKYKIDEKITNIFMSKLLIIGGGEIGKFETLPFDKRNIELTGKKHPKVLFIPTASLESPSYIQAFKKVYQEKLGANVDVLYLLNEKPKLQDLKKKILSSDLIYVGGGNTLKMMKRWRFLGVDKILKEAYKRNIVLSGCSAGGICWFEYGHSDSMSSYDPENWNYIRVKGLGLLEGIHCPHFNSQTLGKKRGKSFEEFMKKYPSIKGVAIDNHAALEIVNGNHSVLKAKEKRGVYEVLFQNSKIIIKKFD